MRRMYRKDTWIIMVPVLRLLLRVIITEKLVFNSRIAGIFLQFRLWTKTRPDSNSRRWHKEKSIVFNQIKVGTWEGSQHRQMFPNLQAKLRSKYTSWSNTKNKQTLGKGIRREQNNQAHEGWGNTTHMHKGPTTNKRSMWDTRWETLNGMIKGLNHYQNKRGNRKAD